MIHCTSDQIAISHANPSPDMILPLSKPDHSPRTSVAEKAGRVGKMSHAQMYARLLAGDSDYNGRFFTGVLTTGIYCLPSCKARKPKAENVRFFPSCEAAREAGLRACKKCHPDDFSRGADPVLADIEMLVAEIRAEPARFADVRAIVRRSGFGATRLFELFRQHYHTTPADLLLKARLVAAKHLLLTTRDGLLDISASTGFESSSVFHQHFREKTGMTPGSYRGLEEAGESSSFTLELPKDYPLHYLRRALSRDSCSVTEKLEGDTYTTAVRLEPSGADSLGNAPIVVLKLELSPIAVHVSVHPYLPKNRSEADAFLRQVSVRAHALVVGLLGLDQDAAAFARLAEKLGLSRLTEGRAGLRLAQTPTVFDGILWSIIGQQINLPFACQLRRRLIQHAGVRLEHGPGADAQLYAPPIPAAVAALDPTDLLPLQFSRQKAGYVIDIARLVSEGSLDLAALRTMSFTRAERTLLAVRGLGPWSVHYIMMRALGFADCVPLGDTGVTSGLLALLNLEERPDIDATRRLMAMFSPYRSLATAHLWQFTQPAPVADSSVSSLSPQLSGPKQT